MKLRLVASKTSEVTLTRPTNFKVGKNNDWLELRELPDGYTYSHELRCGGLIMLVLPYRRVGKDAWEFLVRNEITPCWTSKPTLSGMTGGVEHPEDIREDAVRELKEEAGYTVTKDELVFLGNCRASKSSDTVYILYSVDLAGKEAEEALGDETNDVAPLVWMYGSELRQVPDPHVIVAYSRLVAFGVY